MPCYHPMIGYRAVSRSPTGKRPIVFNAKKGFVDLPITIPCGQCIGCRLEKARQWAVRCVHEASMHQENSFITLTYNNENLPKNGSVSKRDFQLFMKRLRKANMDKEIRFYACGEYGTKLSRPHYHSCLFGFDFKDKEVLFGGKYKKWDNTFNTTPDFTLYRSPSLEIAWPYGFSTIGELNFMSAGYVARYVTKKLTGKPAEEKIKEHYGEKEKEFALMSRRYGIGHGWLEKYQSDVYPKDFFTLKGAKMRPPRYYDNIMEGKNPALMQEIKIKREVQAKENIESGVRLWEREKYKTNQVKQLQRGLEK
ncbi:MAG: replication initiator protein [Arizlama microvirus]|nr:MAG: replication initiator protein [Arizlama microvirus]